MGGQPTDPKAPIHPAPLALARVPFRGGFIEAAQLEGEVWVPIRPVCDALGLALPRQLAKLKGKPWATVTLMVMVAGDGKARQLAAVDLRSLPLWLATIEPSRVKPEARPALVAYQREAADVLYRHILAPPVAPPALPSADLAATRAQLDRVTWTLGLPARAPAPDEGSDPAAQLAADVTHLAHLLGYDPQTGDYPDGVIVPTIDHRSQTVLRLRAWLAECARPLTHEERQGRQGSRGVTAQQAADSYNRWARARGLSPLSAGSLGRWLADSALHGYQRTVSRRGHRYQLALLATPANVPQLPRGGA